jgi:hypothetical protein
MRNASNTSYRSAIRQTFRVLASYILLAGVPCYPVYGQDQEQGQSEKLAYAADIANVPDAIAKVKSGEFAAVHVDLIARANAAEAIPLLEEQFGRVQDPLLKAKIAAAVVRMKGDKDNTYWDFLVKQATPVLESDAPDFKGYDSQGKAVSAPSPEFAAWAKKNGVSPDSAAEESIYFLPGRVLLLGWSRDRRAIPMLRQGLSSPNHMVQIMAALGLAEIGDKASIHSIIDACKKAPADPAAAMAEALIYFDDPEAQAAVDKFVPENVAKIVRDGRAHGRGPLGSPLKQGTPPPP